MRIIWISNVKPQFIGEIDGKDTSAFGGWLYDIGKRLYEGENEFCVLFMSDKTTENHYNRIDVYEFIENGNNIDYFKGIVLRFKPDIIHIWGTEYKHSYDLFKASRELGLDKRVVISIQGILNVLLYHWSAGLPDKVTNNRNIVDIIVGRPSIAGMARNAKKRAFYEEQLLKNCIRVIGRTRWDYACTKLINLNVEFFAMYRLEVLFIMQFRCAYKMKK